MMQSVWECPKCKKRVEMHVVGTRQVSHACSTFGKAVSFKRIAESQYFSMK